MSHKQDANALLQNRFFQLVKNELYEEYFEAWRTSETPEQREALHIQIKALDELLGKIEFEATQYEAVA